MLCMRCGSRGIFGSNRCWLSLMIVAMVAGGINGVVVGCGCDGY